MHGDQAAHDGQGNPGASADEDWAALNAKVRRVAMGYLAQHLLGRMVIIRKVFEPFRTLFSDQIVLGRDRWEWRQRSIAAQSRLRRTQERRWYRMVVAVLGEFEETFLSSIGRLMMEPEEWVHLPPDVMSVRYFSLTFHLLARAGTVHALLQVPHEDSLFVFSHCSPILPSGQTCPSR